MAQVVVTRASRDAMSVASAIAIGAIAVVGCGFSGDAKLSPDGAPAIDAPDAIDPDPPDAPPIPCDMPALTCAGDALRATCPDGEIVDASCAWGCVETNGAHCGAVVPSGGSVSPEDVEPDATLADVMLQGTVDGETGEINGQPASALDAAYRATSTVGIFRFASLHITGPLDLRGNRAIAFVAAGPIIVEGIVDARGACTGREPGPGGRRGGSESDGTGAGGGDGGSTPRRGAGGGGNGGVGGTGATTTAGGEIVGDAAITLLVGGGGGGGAKTSEGGGGGGAVQLVSNTRIEIRMMGGINAGGCGGRGGDGNADAGGGGGGAGGTLLLEAPTILMRGALAVNGGGGANRTDEDGAPGTLDRIAAASAPGAGAGAAGGTADGSPGTGGADDTPNGGGGGGIGWIRLNTGTGSASELDLTGGVMSPNLGDPASTASHARANAR